MTNKLTLDQVYAEFSEKYIHWDRKDANHIIVWTSGYNTADCYEIEKYLMHAGMMAITREFDEVFGKTYTIYRHK